jgi:hypothetical protein
VIYRSNSFNALPRAVSQVAGGRIAVAVRTRLSYLGRPVVRALFETLRFVPVFLKPVVLTNWKGGMSL